MDEKKVREAIAWLETKREIHKRGAYKSPIIPKEQIDMIEGYYNLTIEALEKQLAKKPIEIDDAYTPKNGEFRVAKCPNCGCAVSDRFDVCLECRQKLDWSEKKK
jgi:hypothetical protein